MLRVFAAVGGVLATGTLGFKAILHETWIDAFYRTVVTTSLNGLDSPPAGTAGRLWTVLLVLAGVTIFAYVGAVVVETIAGGILSGALAEHRRRRTIDKLRDHFIICGFGRVGRRVAREFRAAGVRYVVLDFHDDAISARELQLALRVLVGGARDDDQVRASGARRERNVEVVGIGVGRGDEPDGVLQPGLAQVLVLGAVALDEELVLLAREGDRVVVEVEHDIAHARGTELEIGRAHV